MEARMTREEWLRMAAAELRELVSARANTTVPDAHVSVGFPKGSRGGRKAIGQCWQGSASADGLAHIFISPELSAVLPVLETLLHELIHAATPGEGHKGGFVKVAKACGFRKPWTSTPSTEQLTFQLEALAKRLPAYPHPALLAPASSAKPGSRLRLFICECGIKVRVARDDFHATCNDCGGSFQAGRR
jgi:hypothetical protein